jgi:pimeloyl-ACP methyl ester carboxylesterase
VPYFTSRLRLWLAVAMLIVAATLIAGRDHIRAFVMMSCIATPETPLREITPHVFEEEHPNLTAAGPLPARLYIPNKYFHSSTAKAPGVVLLHGVHRLGYNDPRLTNAARSIAAMGIVVYTPQIPDLTEYRVTPDSVAIITDAVHTLSNFLDRQSPHPVGIMALSFTGGLSLIAAADPRNAPLIKFVWTVGAHDDMARVARFYATNEAPRPNGSILRMKAHEYGALVLMYAHLEDFFSAQDVFAAHEAIRLLLREEWNASHDAAAKLSPEGQHLMQMLYDKDRSVLREPLLASIARHEAEYAAVSPASILKNIQVPVLLLHGAGDDVIPPSETEWLAADIPKPYLYDSLISPAVSHVGVGEKPSFADKVRLLNAMEHFLVEAEK